MFRSFPGGSEGDHLRRTWRNLAVTQSVPSAWQQVSKTSMPFDPTAPLPATSPKTERSTQISMHQV